MYMMVTASWPMSSSVDLGKLFLTLPQPPESVQRQSLHFAWSGPVQKAYTIFEMDDADVRQGFVALSNRYAQMKDIPGLEILIEPLLTVEEALPMIGLSA